MCQFAPRSSGALLVQLDRTSPAQDSPIEIDHDQAPAVSPSPVPGPHEHIDGANGLQPGAQQIFVPSASMIQTDVIEPTSRHDLPELPMDGFGIFDDYAMGTFLFDIMNPTNADLSTLVPSGPLPDVLDFAFDDFLALPEASAPTVPNMVAFQSQPVSRPRSPRSGMATPLAHKAAGLGHQAFRESAWMWKPDLGDNRRTEQSYLAIRDETLIEAGISPSDSVHVARLSQSSRDRLLSMVLRSCDLNVQRHVVSCFPSAASLSFILDLISPEAPYEIGRWIHMPSLVLDDEIEELIGALLAVAAASSGQQSLQRLGFAVLEAVRSAVADRFEEDNRNTRDLRTIQSSALLHHVGFWGGDRRQMEIAESFAYPLVTMLRRGGRFKSYTRELSPPDLVVVSRETWLRWANAEAFKRLAYHVFLQDTAVSMSFVTPPLISYTEMHLALPCSNVLWQATSVKTFDQELKTIDYTTNTSIPTLRDCLKDLELLSSSEANIDRQMSLDIIVSCFWGRVWQYRQLMSTPSSIEDRLPSVAANALYEELMLNYRHLQIQTVDFGNGASCWKAKLELCMIHLHVSLEDIQSFAGKDGEVTARRMVPVLQRWFKSSASRLALRHAGQVLRAASQHRTGTPLPGLSAVAVYHASLTMWAYGIWSERDTLDRSKESQIVEERSLMIDAIEGDPHWERFLLLGKGRPCIQDYSRDDHRHSETTTKPPIPLERSLDVMKSVIGLLTEKCGEGHTSPPMVATLTKLMLSLGKAATVTKRAYI